MMKRTLKRSIILVPILAPVLLSACVWRSDYDKLDAQNHQLQQNNAAMQQQITADQAQIARLQGAIKYTVNSDLLFAPGSWEMSPAGQQVIAKMASQLAPMQQSKIVVNGYTDNAPVGRALEREGVTSNLILSQKRAETVMRYLISQGVKPDMVSAQGFGDTNPVAPNNTPQGRSENRRVEIALAPSGS